MAIARILIVDDEKFVRRAVSRVLQSAGMETDEAAGGREAIQMAQKKAYDLIILDIIMEDMDGFQVVGQLRSLGVNTPIFMLSGRQEDNDQILALGIGADGYITKPFSPTVLCAKVKACLRRAELSGGVRTNIISVGPFRYMVDEMRLYLNNTEISLSVKESLMMKYFLSNPDRILSRDQIYHYVWGNDVVDDNTIMVHIRRLRMKIEEDPNNPRYLKTVRGIGYRFSVS